jgi:hypothetical protein
VNVVVGFIESEYLYGGKRTFDRHSLHEADMRALFALLAVVGVAGIASGVLTIIRGMPTAPFSYENYGGPGNIIGGVLLFSVSIYLLVHWPRIESTTRASSQR